jgi:hypothetical protein
MILTLQDIARMKKHITSAESAVAIAADCLDRSMEALADLKAVTLKGDVEAFYISAAEDAAKDTSI